MTVLEKMDTLLLKNPIVDPNSIPSWVNSGATMDVSKHKKKNMGLNQTDLFLVDGFGVQQIPTGLV